MKLKTINFERTTGKALYLQIYEKLRSDILSGYLVKGDQLPSIRKCEALMKVSKTSIERAYEKLLEEGYILSVPQKGFFVDVEPENVQLRCWRRGRRCRMKKSAMTSGRRQWMSAHLI